MSTAVKVPLRLRIVSSGICCAIGTTQAAASCALRAAMDHFQESDFQDNRGEPLRVARLPDTERWGPDRLARWIHLAVHDCLRTQAPVEISQTPVVMLTLEETRPHGQEHELLATADSVESLLGSRLHPMSRIVAGGRAGLGAALLQIEAMALAGHARQFLLIGADTYLNSASINHYLREQRLLTSENSDGFLPGEAAAAVLLQAETSPVAGVYITGVGRSIEVGRPDGSTPSRAQGLSTALRIALRQAGIGSDDLQFRVSDQNGEGFFAGEAADAFTRIAQDGAACPATLTTADCTGEIGAATGPLMLAWMSDLMPRADGPGACGMVHLASDNGERSAVVVQRLA